MKKRALTIAGITAAAVLAAGSALAQSPGAAGDSGTSPMQGRDPRGMGPGMMRNMARGMEACMGADMIQHMCMAE